MHRSLKREITIMDSPEPPKNTSSATATITPAQESPFFSYVNNLSPIKPVKTSLLPQGFLGFSSPPLVFTSPHISSHRETQFLDRSQNSRIDFSQRNDNGGKSVIDNTDDSMKLISQLPGKFITNTQKDFDIKNDAKHCSASLCVDEYLADPANIDCMYSVNADVNQSNDADETSLSDKKGCGNNVEQPEESQNFHQEKPTDVDVERPSQDTAKLEFNLSANQKQHCHYSFAQCAENELLDHCDCTPESMPEPMQGVKQWEDSGEMGPTSHVTAENMSTDGSEASQKLRGMRRRCLQFEEAASNACGSNNISPVPAHIPEDSISSAPSSDSKDLKASHVTRNVTSSKTKMANSDPITPLVTPRMPGYFPIEGSMPSDVGFHLNIIINTMPHAAITDMTLAESCIGLQGVKSASSISCHKEENIKRCLSSSNVGGQSSVGIEGERHETYALTAAGSATSESPGLIEPITSLDPASVRDKRKLTCTNAGNSEEFNQPRIPETKKKKTSSTCTTDDDGKRCNCKKSKCLKLYCDCFAAGTYCAESCACQSCFNRPEYEDTVIETRQQIESRNPLAFAPKIVQRASDYPSNMMADVNVMTPSSARHKRGCNCKRSMCLKKYCECYQANVGCSSGCRCEGCKNVYGRKEGYAAIGHVLSKEMLSSRVERGSDFTFPNNLEMVANKTDLLHRDLYDLHRFSPLTPSLQFSDQGKEAAKSRLLSGKYILSPEADITMFPSEPKNTESSVLLETNEMLGIASYDWQLDCKNVQIMDQSSASCNSVTRVDQLTHNPPSMSNASSYSSQRMYWTHIPPQAQLSHGSSRTLCGSSHRWRSSPITPITGLGETKYPQDLESDSRLNDILEDETREMLNEASIPVKSVKSTSPNRKRVSPPQSHPREPGCSSSGGLRSDRKFILKNVPPFPPLTPCIDSIGNDHDDSGTVKEDPEG